VLTILDANIIGNYFMSGPSISVTACTRGNANFHGYVENNYYDPDQDGTLNGSPLGEESSSYGGMEIVTEKYDYRAVEQLLTPDEVVTYVTGSMLPCRHHAFE
jgi:hypothetical protein